MRDDPTPPLDSDEELDLISRSPRYAVRAVLRRLVWSGMVAVLFVGALWMVTR
ncbi:MAG: hypothetical protein JWQ36_3103 [Enterovirga sp.]|jgi:hypothetical protein|nr:hypothetical protein [Enterovirga sp.]